MKKEAAHIRDLFREGDRYFQRRNIAKLLFFHMNGYPTDFGVTECIKLCASSNFSDKRIAYLGLSILVDETEQILMLLTNSLKQDLSNADINIVTLALNVIGDVASAEMLRELIPDIETLLQSPNPQIRKKAGLAAVRAVRKLTANPEEVANIIQCIPVFFDIRSSAVHISGAALVCALCDAPQLSHEDIAGLKATVIPIIVSILSDHVTEGAPRRGVDMYGSIHEKANPFVIAKLIGALRSLLSVSIPSSPSSSSVEAATTENLGDLLVTIAGQFHHKTGGNSKIIQCAILYEIVRTSSYLRTHSKLRSLVMEILGRFLTHRESTVRYIALQELNGIADDDGVASLSNVPELGEKLLKALQETDSTVRRQAVDLVFRTTDATNVEQMVLEVADYVTKSEVDEDGDAVRDGCEKMFVMADDFSSSVTWKVDVFIRALTLGHRYLANALITALVAFVTTTPSVQPHAVQSLYGAILSMHADAAMSNGVETGEGGMNLLDDGDDMLGVVAKPKTDSPAVEAWAEKEKSRKKGGRRRRMPRAEAAALYLVGECGGGSGAAVNSMDIVRACETLILEHDEEVETDNDDEEYNREVSAVIRTALTTLLKVAARELGVSFGDVSGGDDGGLADMFAGLGLPALPAPAPNSAVLALPSAENEGADLAMQLITMGEVDTQQQQPQQILSDVGVGALVALGLGDDMEDFGSSGGRGEDGVLVTLGLGDDGNATRETAGVVTLYDGKNSTANDVLSRVRRVFSKCVTSADVEIQQRSSEYLALLEDSSRSALARVTAPAPRMTYNGVRAVVQQGRHLRSRRHNGGNRSTGCMSNGNNGGLLLDLLDEEGDGGDDGGRAGVTTVVDDEDPLAALGALVVAGESHGGAAAAGGHAHAGMEDLLTLTMGEEGVVPSPTKGMANIMDMGSITEPTLPLAMSDLSTNPLESLQIPPLTTALETSSPTPLPIPLTEIEAPQAENGSSRIGMGIEVEPGPETIATDMNKTIPEEKILTMIDTDNIRMTISLDEVKCIGEEARREGLITMTNKSHVSMSDCVLKLAVPKYMRLEMEAASADVADSEESIVQTVRLFNRAHGVKGLQFRYIVEFLLQDATEPTRIQGLADNLP